MNTKPATPYNPSDYLKSAEDIAHYLDAALEDGNSQVLMMALRNVADAQGGLGHLAKLTGLNRETLYRTLSDQGNPRLNTLTTILHSLGLRLSVEQERHAAG